MITYNTSKFKVTMAFDGDLRIGIPEKHKGTQKEFVFIERCKLLFANMKPVITKSIRGKLNNPMNTLVMWERGSKKAFKISPENKIQDLRCHHTVKVPDDHDEVVDYDEAERDHMEYMESLKSRITNSQQIIKKQADKKIGRQPTMIGMASYIQSMDETVASYGD